MKKIVLYVMALALVLGMASVAAADKAKDSEALVDKCLIMFKEKGKETTVAAIKDPKGPFVNGELYIFCLSLDNIMVAHPHDKNLRGMNMTSVKDTAGNHFFVRFKEIAHNPGSGWVEYMWHKPGESTPSPKRAFLKRVPEEDLYVGCGYYLK